MTRGEALEVFQNREATPGDQLLMQTILSDAIAAAVLAVWPLDGIRDGWRGKAGLQLPGDASQSELWTSMWDGITVGAEHVGALAGFPPFAVESRVERLIAARLVFPDGSVYPAAVAVALGATSRRSHAPRRAANLAREVQKAAKGR